jgi:hypothetical protein
MPLHWRAFLVRDVVMVPDIVPLRIIVDSSSVTIELLIVKSRLPIPVVFPGPEAITGRLNVGKQHPHGLRVNLASPTKTNGDDEVSAV